MAVSWPSTSSRVSAASGAGLQPLGAVDGEVVLDVHEHASRVGAGFDGGDGEVVETAVDGDRHGGLGRPDTGRAGQPLAAPGRQQRQTRPHPAQPLRVGLRAARGRARGSSGSPRASSLVRSVWVRPSSSAQWRVSWRIASPASSSTIWRAASYSMARPSDRTELRFLISQRVPKASVPRRRTDTLASTRIDPSSILASLTSVATRMARSSLT